MSRKPIPRRRKRIPRGGARFRERELKRAMRAAKASGMPVREITVDPGSGKIAIVVGAASEPGKNPWLDEMEKR